MTEEEWLKDTDPDGWLDPDIALAFGTRKLRLVCVACCRRVSQLLTAECSTAVEVAEAFADGRASEEQLRTAGKAASDSKSGFEGNRYDACVAVGYLAEGDIHSNAHVICNSLARAVWVKGPEKRAERVAHMNALREIFGNPFRPVRFDPAWRTDTALTLARQMYESREFSAAPILADALQDAGCDADELLNHLRDPHAAHVRGCWALDLVLGKA